MHLLFLKNNIFIEPNFLRLIAYATFRLKNCIIFISKFVGIIAITLMASRSPCICTDLGFEQFGCPSWVKSSKIALVF